MDWIERLFGIAPDMGKGSTELLLSATLLMLTVMVYIATNRKVRGAVRTIVKSAFRAVRR